MRSIRFIVFAIPLLGVASGGLITDIIKDLTPVIANVGNIVDDVLKDTASLIGNTLTTVDNIVANSLGLVQREVSTAEGLFKNAPKGSPENLCSSRITSVVNSLDVSTVKACVNSSSIRTKYSDHLARLSQYKSGTASTITKCLAKIIGVRECINREIQTSKTDVEKEEVSVRDTRKDIEKDVTSCVEKSSAKITQEIDGATKDFNKCVKDQGGSK
ncbi:hypothetical protein HHI36_010044 [Cryptolaemus montrouzieri]|uniref:Uncharacterized protein n=1 Tax=Cryptolaemus montrouzieri TaxID=559131 RepID=A0ABD2MHP6_9CUCU